MSKDGAPGGPRPVCRRRESGGNKKGVGGSGWEQGTGLDTVILLRREDAARFGHDSAVAQKESMDRKRRKNNG